MGNECRRCSQAGGTGDPEGVQGEESLNSSIRRLTPLQADPIREPEFMKKWANAVGDTFASRLSLNLLSVR